MTLKDRIKDYITDHRETIIKVLVVAGIAAIISAIIVAGVIDGVHDRLNRLDSDIDDIMAMGPWATEDQLDAIGNRTDGNHDVIGGLQFRLGNAENLINALQVGLAQFMCSPPEGYLTGIHGNYTLHARASNDGSFTANVHLVYSPPISAGNATTQDEALQVFYESIDWAAPYLRDYVCALTYSGTTWGISLVSFNIGTFTMEDNTDKTLDIMYGGLNSTYAPDFAYVELYPVLE